MFSPINVLCFIPLVFLVLLQPSNGGRGLSPPLPESCDIPPSSGGPSFPQPVNCHLFECVPYTVIYTEKAFEIRKYEDALWVSAPNITMDNYKSAASIGFLMLYKYFNGNNTEKVIINMTIPVLIDVQNSTYTVRYYMPKKYQNGSAIPPHPLNPDIKPARQLQGWNVAVRRFGGNITNEVIPREVAALNESLWKTSYKAAAVAAAAHGYTVAAYNSPFETKDRVNEVWFKY